jgi:hypothetical protein
LCVTRIGNVKVVKERYFNPDPAMRACHSNQFLERGALVDYVLEDTAANHEIEALVSEGQATAQIGNDIDTGTRHYIHSDHMRSQPSTARTGVKYSLSPSDFGRQSL